MTALVAHAPTLRLNWPRIGALSGTMSLHAAVILLLLTPPVAMQVLRAVEEKPTVVDIIMPQEPIPLKEPDLPQPKHKEAPPPRQRVERPAPQTTQTVVTDATPVSTVADESAPPGPPQVASTPAQDIAPTPLGYQQKSRIPYPIEALRRHEQGTVILRVLVGADGNPESVEIERSSGSPRLDAAARDAVRHLTFKPGTRNGVAQSAWARVPIVFDLTQL